jgi:hypothetical protein
MMYYVLAKLVKANDATSWVYDIFIMTARLHIEKSIVYTVDFFDSEGG